MNQNNYHDALFLFIVSNHNTLNQLMVEYESFDN